MAAYPIPNPQYGIYNQNNFSPQTTGQSGLTIDEGKKYFLTFPNAQTTQTEFLNDIGVGGSATFEGPVYFNDIVEINEDITFTKDVIVEGTVTIGSNLLCELTATITNILTCENGIDISTVGTGLTFPDNTTQTTAFIEANYAQLNTDNIFLAPYKQIFQQNSSTVPSTSPIQINNITNSDNIAFYIDPSAGNDLTLYSSQTNGGLTVRTPTASFTLNPITISPGVVGAQSLNPIDMNGYGIFGLVNVYADGASITFCDSGTAPMLQLTNGGHTSYENLNMNNNTIYGASSISSPIFYVGNYGQITNQTTSNPQILVIRNTYNNSGNNAQIYFQINDTTGGVVSPFQINWNGLNSTVGLNMNNNNITSIGSGSTAYTQPIGTSNTSIATTAYVQNMFVTQTIPVAANNLYYAIQPSFNTFVASYIALDNSQYQVTINTILSTSNPIILVSNSSMPINTVNTITLTYTGGVTVPWAPPTGTAFGKIVLENSDLGTQISPRISLYNNAMIITLPALTYLSPSTNYNIYIVKNNVTV